MLGLRRRPHDQQVMGTVLDLGDHFIHHQAFAKSQFAADGSPPEMAARMVRTRCGGRRATSTDALTLRTTVATRDPFSIRVRALRPAGGTMTRP